MKKVESTGIQVMNENILQQTIIHTDIINIARRDIVGKGTDILFTNALGIIEAIHIKDLTQEFRFCFRLAVEKYR